MGNEWLRGWNRGGNWGDSSVFIVKKITLEIANEKYREEGGKTAATMKNDPQ